MYQGSEMHTISAQAAGSPIRRVRRERSRFVASHRPAAAAGISSATGPLASRPSPIHANARRRGQSRPFSRWRHRSSVDSVSSRFSSESAVAARPISIGPRLVARMPAAAMATCGPKRRQANCPMARHHRNAHSADGSRTANSLTPNVFRLIAWNQ